MGSATRRGSCRAASRNFEVTYPEDFDLAEATLLRPSAA